MSITTLNIEKNTLSSTIALLIQSGLVIEILDENQEPNKAYTTHEFVAKFIINKLEREIVQAEIEED